MSELSKRLREEEGWYLEQAAHEAADRIDALEAENKALREGIESIVSMAASRSVHPMDGHSDYFRAARALLAKEAK